MDEDAIVENLAPALKRAAQEHLLSKTVLRMPIFGSDRSYVTRDRQLHLLHLPSSPITTSRMSGT